MTWRGERSVERDPLFAVPVLVAILQIVKDGRRKSVAFQVLGDESLASKRGTKCTQKPHVQKCMGSVILQFSSMKKSRAPEHVKRDPHTSDFLTGTMVD